MAKCNQLTPLPFKELKVQLDRARFHRKEVSANFGKKVKYEESKKVE